MQTPGERQALCDKPPCVFNREIIAAGLIAVPVNPVGFDQLLH